MVKDKNSPDSEEYVNTESADNARRPPQSHTEAMSQDQENGNTAWQDEEKREIDGTVPRHLNARSRTYLDVAKEASTLEPNDTEEEAGEWSTVTPKRKKRTQTPLKVDTSALETLKRVPRTVVATSKIRTTSSDSRSSSGISNGSPNETTPTEGSGHHQSPDGNTSEGSKDTSPGDETNVSTLDSHEDSKDSSYDTTQVSDFQGGDSE